MRQQDGVVTKWSPDRTSALRGDRLPDLGTRGAIEDGVPVFHIRAGPVPEGGHDTAANPPCGVLLRHCYPKGGGFAGSFALLIGWAVNVSGIPYDLHRGVEVKVCILTATPRTQIGKPQGCTGKGGAICPVPGSTAHRHPLASDSRHRRSSFLFRNNSGKRPHIVRVWVQASALALLRGEGGNLLPFRRP